MLMGRVIQSAEQMRLLLDMRSGWRNVPVEFWEVLMACGW